MSSSTAIYPSLRDKVVLITGGAEGIGAAAVKLFCRQGSKVVVFDIQRSFYFCDVTDLQQLNVAAHQVLGDYGRVDVLVNNAAATGARSHLPSDEVTPLTWDMDVNVNLRHVFFLTQAVVPSMRSQRSGSIINMGSISWRVPQDGIRVNSVMPGHIVTERQTVEVMTTEYRDLVQSRQTLKRDLMPEEVASVILFLASDDSSAVTGSSYAVDGGWVSDP
ncbi:hypothetical protein M409DRAFT_70376 [Zasmidium cellare ATCC 36951]|uniref:Uncharacterized protein n=1 Tax=Zasmidium cellare ATCC 36951 TaxID=1080233 RepID=A0A6A6C0S5_ZASCE|nr:uncharacterized protein M409DRAFT_70376 [Zasmidium cellare ATCC 36951]KAF2160644.1 hypothetical protein M409DRAFT_70376 [Zasmidium cellare ATCC 36951]